MSIDAVSLADKHPAEVGDNLLRTEFALLSGAYLDVAARGPLPASAAAAVQDVLHAQLTGKVPKADWLNMVNTARAAAAALLGASPEDLAFTKNVSEGLNIVAAALRLRRGDRIVVAPATEHPNNILPWLWQAQEHGAELVTISPTPDLPLEEAILAGLDSSTRLVAVSALDFATGRRTDLQVIGAACRARGIFLLVDAAQSAGVVADRLCDLPVDGWATAAQKGLLTPYGLGLLYVRREWAEQLRPVSLARFSVNMNETHEAAGPDGGWQLRDGAGRFEVGNYNYVAMAALRASVELLLAFGLREVERRAFTAAAVLRSELEALDIPVLPLPLERQSHIVAIADAQGSGHDASEIGWVNSLSQALTAGNVVHSVRRGAVRLSTHVHVLPETLELAIECIRSWRRR
jgi:selenocysteine lyase/cysteine desulfurase